MVLDAFFKSPCTDCSRVHGRGVAHFDLGRGLGVCVALSEETLVKKNYEGGNKKRLSLALFVGRACPSCLLPSS